MEAIADGVGNGLVQYGKDDCTYGDKILYFPGGVTFGDILLMQITQFSPAYSTPTVSFYKAGATQMARFDGGIGQLSTPDATCASISLPMDYSSSPAGSWFPVTQTCIKDSITDCIIIVKK